MIFQWDPDVPLVVDENIQLPQLALVKNNTADCTQVYSTGKVLQKELIIIETFKYSKCVVITGFVKIKYWRYRVFK